MVELKQDLWDQVGLEMSQEVGVFKQHMIEL
jgi:hypothetical protein